MKSEKKRLINRMLAFVLAFLMVFTSVDVQVFAAEETEHVHTEECIEDHSEEQEKDEQDVESESEEAKDESETNLVDKVQDKVDTFVEVYGFSSDMSDKEIENAIYAMDGDTLKAAWEESVAIKELGEGLSGEELESLQENKNVEVVGKFYLTMEAMMTPQVVADGSYSTSQGLPEGIQVNVSNATSASCSDGVATITAKGSAGFLGMGASAKTATVTITNSSNEKAIISFDWTATSVNQLEINGTIIYAEEGRFQSTLASSDSITVKVTTAKNSTENKLVMSNFVLTKAQDVYAVTFKYDSNMGDVVINGEQVSSDRTIDVSIDGAELVVNSKNGAVFLGWIREEDNSLISREASFNFKPVNDISIRAIFVNEQSEAHFMAGTTTAQSYKYAEGTGIGALVNTFATTYNYSVVNGTHLYTSLDEALEGINSTNSKTLVLLNDATLTGNHTIPKGVTVLIPFDEANTLYTTEPVPKAIEEYSTPVAYRTLTLADGAKLNIEGAVSLSAQHTWAAGSKKNGGSPTGNVSFLKMEGNSEININNGGTLYAYGYITGCGSVNANSGANVYEYFQIMDFRGGTQSTDMDNGVFPLSQYYVQNIEVPLTIKAGATEYSYTSITMSSCAFGSSVGFIGGSGSMFNLSDGSVTKYYDGSTDRLMVEANGVLTMSSINLSIGTTSINSKDYDLGINGNITVTVNKGSDLTIGQDIAMLPGAEIIIKSGATCRLNSGNNVYVYDLDEWGTYCGSINQKILPISYAPGKIYNRTVADLKDAMIRVDGTMDASAGNIYTTAGGANIFSTGSGYALINPGKQEVTHQIIQATDPTNSEYVPITITSAKLMNADGAYIETANENGTYIYKNAIWHTPSCGADYTPEITVQPTCTENGEGVYTCACGNSYEGEVEALGHTEEIVKGTPAGCLTEGVSDGRKCSVCEEVLKKQETLPAKGHTIVTIPGYAPTCTQDGRTDGIGCAACDYIEQEQGIIPATGHTQDSFVIENEIVATCTKGGSHDQVFYCTSCNIELERISKTTDSLGHIEVDVAETPADCITAGLTAGKKCSRCSVFTVEQEEIPATGHTEIDVEGTAPTCTEKGLSAGKKCSVCGVFTVAQTEIAANGHTNKAAVKENDIAATCTKDGSYDMVVYCSVCDREVSRATTTLPALGHVEGEAIEENRIEPTCYKEGSYDVVIYCTTCNEVAEKETKTINKTAHTSGEVVVENREEATCAKTGKYDEVVYCSVEECKAEISRETTVIPTKEHSIVADDRVEATCTETGLSAGSHCSECGYIQVKQEEIPAKGHKEGNAVKEKEVAATCAEAGSYDSVVYCTVCKAEVSREQVAVEALGHTPGAEATCETAQICTVCTEELVPATGHTEVVLEAVEATCIATGLTEGKKCSVCNKILEEQQVIEALGHDYDEGTITTAPTCTGTGIKTYTCKNDSTHKKTEIVSAKGHAEVTLEAVEATCTETGLTEGKECSVCGMILLAQEVVEAKGHQAGDFVKENDIPATCTEAGSYDTAIYCSACNVELSRVNTVVPAKGHTEAEEVKENEIEATCKNTGSYDLVVYCQTCDAELSRTANEVAKKPHTLGEEATCENDQICTACNSVIVEALGHDYVETIKTPAKCEIEGEKEYTCSRCEDSYSEVIPALVHVWAYVPSKEATCTEPGESSTAICTLCYSSKQGEPIPALGHAWNDGEVLTKATCISEGEIKYTCTRANCNETLIKETDKLPHTEVTVEGKEPTCTGTGLTAGVQCSVCKTWLTEQEEILAKGHTVTVVTGKDATCTETGLTDGEYCDVCNTWIKEQNEIPAKGHTEKVLEAVAPTCTKTGLTDGKVCTVCYEVLKEQEEVNALGHAWDEGTVTLAPTCTGSGVIAFVCGTCGTKKTDDIDAIGHIEEIVKGYAATCTKPGLTDGKECSVCGHTIEEQSQIPATGHTEGRPVEENRKDATCTSTGSYDTVIYCAVENCGAQISRVTTTIAAIDHTEKVLAAVEATCTETGLTEGKQCSVCNEILLEQEVIAATGHTEKVLAAVKETCTETGLTEGKQCSVCNEILVEQRVIAAKGHTENVLKAVEATCTETGLTKGKKCVACGEILVKQDIIPAKGHTEVVLEAVEATCTKTGLTEGKKCSVCNEVLVEQERIAAKGHTEVVLEAVEATCTETGLGAGKQCTVCNVVTKPQEVIPAKGHTSVEDKAVAPTCTETGLTAGSHCSVCNTTLVEQEEVSALGHTEVILSEKEATCTKTGLTEGKKCSVCNQVLVKQEIVPALGHTEKVLVSVAPTCTKTGLTEGKKCSVCNEVLVEQEIVLALGHTEVTDEAVKETCITTGLTAGSHCSVCNAILEEQVIIPATGHTYVDDKAVEPTCEENGFTAGRHCSVCETVFVKQEEIPATGHIEVVDKASEPTCDKAGNTQGSHCSVCDKVLVKQEEIPALGHEWGTGRVTVEPTCDETGERTFTCSICRETKVEAESALGHDLITIEAQKPSYTEVGWETYERCTRCLYSTYVEIPALGEAEITAYEDFIKYLAVLEDLADTYVKKVSPGKDPLMLVIKYIRTGVDRYNSGSWNIMAGYEDAEFAKYVSKYEAEFNSNLEEGEEMLAVTGMKNIEPFFLPNGNYTDIGHMFGTMDISYTNSSSINHADVAGWAGDLTDLLSLADQFGVEATSGEALVKEITEKYFLRFEEEFPEEVIEGTFSETDVRGDLDGLYVMQQLYAHEYSNGTITDIIENYMTESLTDEDRAEYFLNNRLNGVSLRGDVRDSVYNAYVGNSVVATLEATREFNTSDLTELRKACCYAYADYICKLAGDYVDSTSNPYYSVFQSTTSTLAPGITQKINYATTADNKTMVYYIATGDITRDDVTVYANYNNNDPSQGWAMQRVIDQANAAQNKYGNPESEQYIENYNVIASINGDGYDMSTGEPGGLLVMDGREWHECDGNGFFAILADGTAMIGSKAEYEALKAEGKVKEAIGAFGTSLVKDGKINIQANSDYYTDRASRTAVGITATGKVVFMVLDGRQGEFSCGGSAVEIAQIMLEAGCYNAVNLDGGGSSTYVARVEGDDKLSVVSSPSDGVSRSVSTSLLMVSTAASDTAFDHAVLTSDYYYLTKGSSTKFYARPVSATGNSVEMPEGTTWDVSDDTIGTITEDGVFRALSNGETAVNLVLDGKVVGTKKVYVVLPDNVYFEKEAISAIYGEETVLPVRAVYEGKEVAINENDVVMSLGNAAAGTINGFIFVADENSALRQAKVTAALAHDESIKATISLALYTKDEVSFDFENAVGGDRQLAWDRYVNNSVIQDKNIYRVINPEEDMVTEYTFAIDMSKIDIPKQLEDLTYMLPGADMENASAWNFLLQLAERVSVLTEVRPVLYFDKNLEVDYSNLTIVNEYFELKDVIMDEDENSLTLILNWIDQTEPIDADTANPLCILNGLKLTPKDTASWNSKNQLSLVNKGTIGYDIYLRTSALYTFASKPENQEMYGLKPFINPNDESEKGGAFGSVYKEFIDSYTLINAIKDGWVIEDGGFAYYEDGERYTGIQEIDGFYYDFGDNGINIGQTKFTGEMTAEDGNIYYLVEGVMQSGWIIIDEKNIRYFNPETFVKEQLTADELKSTCIIDGYCIYTSESGAVKRIDYDDAGGHEYVKQADGSYVCSVCNHVRVEMQDIKVELSYYECTYTGAGRTPATTAIAKDGTILRKPGQTDYPDYYSTYSNNVNVGTATVKLTAAKYGVYANLQEWRGNAAGSITVEYVIKPDLPTNVKLSLAGDEAVMTWTAAKAPEVTYVLYKSTDGESWEEFATTTETEYSVDVREYKGCMFKVGTRKVVDGSTYDSINLSRVLYMSPQVTTSNRVADGKPMLKWGAVAGATSYEVYRSISENGTYSKVFTATGTTYTHTSATVDKTYYYKVVAVFADGTQSLFSDIVKNVALCGQPVVSGSTDETGRPVVTWNEVTGAAYYTVYRSEEENGVFKAQAVVQNLNFVDDNTESGKVYYYQVVAGTVTGNTGAESETVTVESKVPQRLTITTGNNTEGKPTLRWDLLDGAVSYEVYRSTSESGTYAKVFTTTGKTYTHASATAGRSYFYKVKVVYENGMEVFSEVVKNTYIIPESEFVITKGNNTEGKPTLKWNAVDGAKNYEIWRSTTEDGTYVKVFTTTGKTYTHASATAGRSYFYKIKANYEDGTSVTSQIVTNTCLIPEGEFDITTGNNVEGKPTMKWIKIVGASNYEVYRSTTENGTYTKVFTTTGTTYTHVSATAGRSYFYKLKVNYEDGTSETSQIVTNTCLGSNGELIITTGNNTEGKPTLKWTKMAGVSTYEVHRSTTENGTYTKVFTTTGTTYTHVSATAGKSYYYKINMIQEDGTSKFSEVVTNTCK